MTVGLLVQPAQAQTVPKSNVDVLGDLAVGCIASVPDSLSSFVLDAGDRMVYLQPRLTSYWRAEGKDVFLADTTVAANLPAGLHRLGYFPQDALVAYADAGGSRLTRDVSLTIAYRLLAPTGLLLDEGRCRDDYADTIDRREIVLVERDPFPETRGVVPPEGSWRDWAEPVALGAAVGVVAYLFFTIRSS